MVILKHHRWNRRKWAHVWRRTLDLHLRDGPPLHLRDIHQIIWILPAALMVTRHILLIGLQDILGSNLLLRLSNHIDCHHPLRLHHILVGENLLLSEVSHLLRRILSQEALRIELIKIGWWNTTSSTWRMWGQVSHWRHGQFCEWLLLLMLRGILLILHLLINYK